MIPQPNCTNFCKETSSTTVLKEYNTPDWPILDVFHPLIGLTGNNNRLNSTSGFMEGARNTQGPSNSTRFRAPLSVSDRHLE